MRTLFDLVCYNFFAEAVGGMCLCAILFPVMAVYFLVRLALKLSGRRQASEKQFRAELKLTKALAIFSLIVLFSMVVTGFFAKIKP